MKIYRIWITWNDTSIGYDIKAKTVDIATKKAWRKARAKHEMLVTNIEIVKG